MIRTVGQPARIEILGVDGQQWTVSGPGEGEQGVTLASGPGGLHDEAPFTTIWQNSAFQEGSTLLGSTIDPIDLVLAFDIDGEYGSWQDIESRFHASFDRDRPATIVYTSESGRRTLQVTKLQHATTKADRDPRLLHYSQMVLTLRAAWPFWQGRTVTHEWSHGSTLTGSQSVNARFVVDNPTDRPIWPQWAMTAPATWTLPDGHVIDGEVRRIKTPRLDEGQDLTIDTYPRAESYVAIDGSNIAGRFGGVEFIHSIPPRTYKAQLPFVLNGPADGAALQLRLVEYWTRPWGGEL